MNSIGKPSSTSSHTYSYHKLLNFNPNTNPFYRSVSYISFKVFRKKSPKRPLICASCNNFPHNLISLVTPVWENIRNFSANAAKKTWVSSSTLNPVTDNIVNDQKTRFLYNGGIGMALLSVKSTAQDRFSPVVAALANNPTFVCGFLALFLAQSIKVMLNFVVEREWNMRKLCTSGGMPSSHSALCTALTTSVALCHGVADSLFPVCLGFSVIVMYDAIGVRRHAGMQAEVLNKIIEDLFQGHPISERKLKELLGHTPLQVFAGALLGIAVAWYCCQGFLVRI